MAGNNLLSLVENIQTWDRLEKRIADLPTEIERGKAFEEFCHAFFLLDPVFQFQQVYRQNEIPPSVRQRLGYPGIQDLGIDGVGITDDGRIFAYQAKFRSDRKVTPSLRELSTFFTLSDKADWRITIANANKLPSSIDNRVRQSRILADRFDALDADFFERLITYLKTSRVAPPAKKEPHITQREAITAAVSYYEKNNRGQLILPCGAGKTLGSIWISEKLGAKKILIMLPSLSLLSQTLKEWAINSSLPFRYLCICSDTTVDLGNDAPIENISDMDVPVTTELQEIQKFLNATTSKTSIIFSTYQSSKVLSDAVRKSGATFDIGIFDEAHRTAGTKIGAWGTALDDANIPINKRIFMTATPKIYAPHITKKAKEEDVLICSMDDADMYGKPFYEIGFAEAVKRDHITDYKVIVGCVTDSEVKKVIEQGGRVITDQDHEWDAKALAKRIALVKGIRAYDLRKAFTFHGRVESAKAFTDTSKPYGIDKIFNLIEPEKETQKSVGFFHVNGTMSSGERSNILKEFESVDIGIISNARCLTEGVNIPAVDTVAFIDPKRSLIDIVQATGRAMRKAEWKEKGYIFIPVFLEEDSDPEQIIKNSDFGTVWEVLQAMLDQDERLQGIVSKMRIIQGKGEEGSQAWKDAMTEYAEKIEFYDLPVKIDKTRFIEKLNTIIVEIISRQWDFWYGMTLRYKEQSGDPNVSKDHKTPDGLNLGFWQDNIRQSYKKGTLSHERIKMLSDIGFKWSTYSKSLRNTFDGWVLETLKYKDSFGQPNAPPKCRTNEGYRLGSWQDHMRMMFKRGELSDDRITKLKDIGFEFNPHEALFEEGFQETLEHTVQFSDANAKQDYINPRGFPLGRWRSKRRDAYKFERLSQDKIQRLEAIGFKWTILKERFEDGFEKGFNETLKYKESSGGNPHADQSHISASKFRLGKWQSNIRSAFINNMLSLDKIKRLEDVGFKWNLKDDKFEKGMQETLNYMDQSGGDPNVTTKGCRTKDDHKLRQWQYGLRRSYKNGWLTPDKIQALERIGFRWEVSFLQSQFERGIEESLKCKKIFGDPNVKQSYMTEDSFNLGTWQNTQRRFYKKGKLSPDRIKRLEDIGFKWRR